MVTYTLEEVFQNSTSFLVDETRDTLDTTTTSKAANSRLSNALDIVAQDFTMALCTSLSEALATFSTASYGECARQKGEKTVEIVYTDTLLMMMMWWLDEEGGSKFYVIRRNYSQGGVRLERQSRPLWEHVRGRKRRSLNLICHVLPPRRHQCRLQVLGFFSNIRTTLR